ncbi:hypothetical protein [Microbacterium gilvum]|uniref:hypothetical protein n=1 Tax=Microbacterium gilvum TaxID=1336204 RepID=UPI0031E9D9C1
MMMTKNKSRVAGLATFATSAGLFIVATLRSQEVASTGRANFGNSLQTDPVYWMLMALSSLTWLATLTAFALYPRKHPARRSIIVATTVLLWLTPALFVAALAALYSELPLSITFALGILSLIAGVLGVTFAILVAADRVPSSSARSSTQLQH